MKYKGYSIIVICSVYNGEIYLKNQLDSLFFQTYQDFRVFVRDDGSSDRTLEILKSYDIELLFGNKNLAVKCSFETLLKYALENSDADYFMFCDQDDIWYENKVAKTLSKMKELENMHGKDNPLLVHTDLEVVNENLDLINPSFIDYQKLDYKKDSLNSLLVQNIVTGCTMMINRQLAQKCLPVPDGAIMHDWWIGLVASQFGKIGYIDESTIKYRQHTSNTIGAKGFDINFVLKSISKKVSLSGNISQAKAFLEKYKDELDVETIKMLEDFTALEQKSWWQKRTILWKYKLLKQGFIRNAGLFLKI